MEFKKPFAIPGALRIFVVKSELQSSLRLRAFA
jgi:hypothetical protein